MPFDYPDALIERVLSDSKTIALVGASPRPERASFRV
ncbi:MAG: putative CoA-binding protein, partial [Alphaproteobacteria bacterium]